MVREGHDLSRADSEPNKTKALAPEGAWRVRPYL
jgi:hypothetical protein